MTDDLRIAIGTRAVTLAKPECFRGWLFCVLSLLTGDTVELNSRGPRHGPPGWTRAMRVIVPAALAESAELGPWWNA